MKTALPYVVIVILLGYITYLNIETAKNTDSIDELYSKVEDLNSTVKELEDKLLADSSNQTGNELNSQLESIHEQEIALLEEQIELDKKRNLQQTVFYGLIKDSQYEDYITATTYTNPRNRNLDKVAVSITGTDNIINFLMHISSESHFAYIESQTNY